MSARITLTILAAAFGFCPLTASAEKTGAKRGGYVDVRTYLPQGYVTDGSVDYREQIQKCFDENAYVYFPGSNDHGKPVIYGSTVPLKTKRFSVVRFGTNAILGVSMAVAQAAAKAAVRKAEKVLARVSQSTSHKGQPQGQSDGEIEDLESACILMISLIEEYNERQTEQRLPYM